MKRRYSGFDHRVRLCGHCHSWFLSQGAHSRFCASCWAEMQHSLAQPWELEPSEAIDRDYVAAAVKEPVAG